MAVKTFFFKSQSPILKYGIAVILLILWYSLIWSPLSARLDDLKIQKEAQEIKINKLQRNLTRLKNIDIRLNQTRQKVRLAKLNLIKGRTPELVASKLQDILLKKASELNLNVVTYKTAPVRKWHDYQVAVSNFTINTNTRQLVKFLKLIQQEKKALRIKSINIIKIMGRKPVLRVNLELEALFLPGG